MPAENPAVDVRKRPRGGARTQPLSQPDHGPFSRRAKPEPRLGTQGSTIRLPAAALHRRKRHQFFLCEHRLLTTLSLRTATRLGISPGAHISNLTRSSAAAGMPLFARPRICILMPPQPRYARAHRAHGRDLHAWSIARRV